MFASPRSWHCSRELGTVLPGWRCPHTVRDSLLAHEGSREARARSRILPASPIPPAAPASLCPPSRLADTPALAGPHPAHTDKGVATPLIRKFEAFPWVYQLPVFPGPRSFCPCRAKSDSHLLCCCKRYKDKALPHKYSVERFDRNWQSVFYSAGCGCC